MSLKCPKCNGELLIQKIGKNEIDTCDHCKGILFDSGELAELLKTFDNIYDKGSEKTRKYISKIHENLCPKCHIRLKTNVSIAIPDLEIDYCQKCSGIYLDVREFSKIKRGKLVNKKYKYSSDFQNTISAYDYFSNIHNLSRNTRKRNDVRFSKKY